MTVLLKLETSLMDTEMMDNDDPLGEELDHEAEKIAAISQLSPMTLHKVGITSNIHVEKTNDVPSATNIKDMPYSMEKVSTNPDGKGIRASKKLQALRARPSPKKKQGSGTVVSQKPPSKKI